MRREMLSSLDVIRHARELGIAIPGFNIPYLPMVEPVVRAVVDTDSFAFVEVARPEWIKFEAQSPKAVLDEYRKWENPGHVRIHLDHVPVVDEDGQPVEYLPIIKDAIKLGYHSVMVDGSRLDLDRNIEATKQVVELAHNAGIACEAELGAVMGHEEGPLPPYEEIFESGRGFTDVEQAKRFVRETGCDWLSVAIGNVHGAISKATKHQKKLEARLDLDHLDRLSKATGVPLVLHGGSGIRQECMLAAMKKGIAKVNVGTEIRQAYEFAIRDSGTVSVAQEAVYDRTAWLIRDYFQIGGIRPRISKERV